MEEESSRCEEPRVPVSPPFATERALGSLARWSSRWCSVSRPSCSTQRLRRPTRSLRDSCSASTPNFEGFEYPLLCRTEEWTWSTFVSSSSRTSAPSSSVGLGPHRSFRQPISASRAERISPPTNEKIGDSWSSRCRWPFVLLERNSVCVFTAASAETSRSHMATSVGRQQDWLKVWPSSTACSVGRSVAGGSSSRAAPSPRPGLWARSED